MTAEHTLSTEQLWAEFASDVRRFLRSRLPNETVADDLLQEVFLRVHRKGHELQQASSARAWVVQIARNLIIDYYRGEGRRADEAIDEHANYKCESEVPAETIHQQVSGWLRTAIDALPVTYREATRLSAVAGLSQQEIADRLELSLEAAKSRIRRGRQQLKQSLVACCSFERDGRGNLVDYQPLEPGSCCKDGESCADKG